MDFEQQLEKAEKLPTPSLVGSSLRSADDSPHNNYIHPEKYLSSKDKKKKLSKKSKFKQSITASLDDLISEGALLGSEEDFEKFLDDDGHVKEQVEYTPSQEKPESALFPETKHSPLSQEEHAIPIGKAKIEDEEEVVIPTPASSSVLDKAVSEVSSPTATEDAAKSFYSQEDYSTPNLSQYQLDNAIKDHLDLLSSIKSEDPHRLPKSDSNSAFRKSPKAASFSTASTGDFVAPPQKETPIPVAEGLITAGTKDGLHTPFFHTEPRSRSRSQTPASRSDRSRSRSYAKPHLARGDSYKNTHVEDPGKYELPAALADSSYPEEESKQEEEDEEDEEDDRRTRHSKPTMGESIAAAEAQAAESKTEPEPIHFSRDPSLVTSGDYTNFNVDAPSHDLAPSANMYATRSISSTNYLRSISRSRSRARTSIDHENEKNDANPSELAKEGALITDDPYSTISNIDEMVDGVLHPKHHGSQTPDRFKQDADSIQEEEEPEKPAEEKSLDQQEVDKLDDLKLNSDIVPEDKKEGSGSVVSAKDIHVKLEELPEEHSAIVREASVVDPSEVGVDNTVSDGEPKGHTVTADDIHVEKDDEAEAEEDLETTRDSIGEAEPVITKDLHIDESKDANPEVVDEAEDNEPELAIETKDVDSKEAEVKEPEAEPEIVPDIEDVLEQEPVKEATAAKDEPEETAGEVEPEASEVKPEVEPEVSEVEPELEESEQPKHSEVLKGVESEVAEAEPKVAEPEVAKEIETSKPAASIDDDDLDDLNIPQEEIREHLKSLPIYVYTSLAGGMQIMQKTNRLATILQANGVKFEYRDLGTDEAAKKIWKRSSNGRLLPGVVRDEDIIGNYAEIDEANEEYKLHDLLYENF